MGFSIWQWAIGHEAIRETMGNRHGHYSVSIQDKKCPFTESIATGCNSFFFVEGKCMHIIASKVHFLM